MRTLSHRTDFAHLIKAYRANPDGERRYNPAEGVSTERVRVIGSADPARICSSIVERQNLTMGMQIRRLTKLTNTFSQGVAELMGVVQLLPRLVHRSLGVTPAKKQEFSIGSGKFRSSRLGAYNPRWAKP